MKSLTYLEVKMSKLISNDGDPNWKPNPTKLRFKCVCGREVAVLSIDNFSEIVNEQDPVDFKGGSHENP